jgi:hypothetical protein
LDSSRVGLEGDEMQRREDKGDMIDHY